MTQRERYGDEVYDLRIVQRRDWGYVYEKFPNVPPASLRRICYQERQRRGELADRGRAPEPHIEGITADEDIDEGAVIADLLRQSEARKRREKRRRMQSIEFDHGPVALTFLADIHAGSDGTDYARLIRDLEVINDTPGMYAVFCGDVLDNFIIGKLKRLLMGRDISIGREWVAVKWVLETIAPKLLLMLSGNHDLWTYMLSGIDYLRDVAKEVRPDVLYDKLDATVAVCVGGGEVTLRARHNWKGSSIYNDTHGIERAAKFDKGRHFDIGVGAHTHASGLSREFNNGGRTGLAILCGAYKRYDDHAERIGFPEANEATAVTAVIGEGGIQFGTNNLHAAAAYMRAVYRE